MSILLTNAILVDIDPMNVEAADLRIEADRITERGTLQRQATEEVIDCGGAIVMPGLVNGHTHLYSALAVGMPAPPRTPSNFHEILQFVWWRLDRALDETSNELSATLGALEALHCGTTTLIDHHASPSAIEGSLDAIERGIDSVGLRGVLCYEVTDRHGHAGRDAGLEESRRYASKCALAKNGRFAAMIGAHALFTLGDYALECIEGWADEFGVGVHIHVAEDPCDDAICIERYGAPLIDRMDRHRLFNPRNVIGHGTHLSDEAIAKVNESGVTLAHNARSNMNNAVGYAPLAKLTAPVMLGTDGIGADMFEEARAAWFKSRDGHAGFGVERVIGMLVASARRASQSLRVRLGVLQAGAAADVVVTDYVPATPLDTASLAGHVLYSLASRHVRHVLAAGRWALKDRAVVLCDQASVRVRAKEAASRLWMRMSEIPR